MKLISSNRGKRVLINSYKPYCGFYDVKFKVYYPAVSSGTESYNISSTKLNSTINKNNLFKVLLLIKKFEFFKIIKINSQIN